MFQHIELFSEVSKRRAEQHSSSSDTWKSCFCVPAGVSTPLVPGWVVQPGLSRFQPMLLLLWSCSPLVERDIKRFLVYSYRPCSGQRSIEIDTAITAGLVTGCGSRMLHEAQVAVAGGVPPARRPQAYSQALHNCYESKTMLQNLLIPLVCSSNLALSWQLKWGLSLYNVVFYHSALLCASSLVLELAWLCHCRCQASPRHGLELQLTSTHLFQPW